MEVCTDEQEVGGQASSREVSTMLRLGSSRVWGGFGRDRRTTKYLCNVRLFSVEVIVIDAQAAQPGGAVER